jgi:hypothetical protein
MNIIVHLPVIYVMTFLIAAFFEQKSQKRQAFIVLAFVCAFAEVLL